MACRNGNGGGPTDPALTCVEDCSIIAVRQLVGGSPAVTFVGLAIIDGSVDISTLTDNDVQFWAPYQGGYSLEYAMQVGRDLVAPLLGEWGENLIGNKCYSGVLATAGLSLPYQILTSTGPKLFRPASDCVVQAVSAINASIGDDISQCVDGVGECTSIVAGDIGVIGDSARAITDKVRASVDKSIMTDVNYAISQMGMIEQGLNQLSKPTALPSLSESIESPLYQVDAMQLEDARSATQLPPTIPGSSVPTPILDSDGCPPNFERVETPVRVRDIRQLPDDAIRLSGDDPDRIVRVDVECKPCDDEPDCPPCPPNDCRIRIPDETQPGLCNPGTVKEDAEKASDYYSKLTFSSGDSLVSFIKDRPSWINIINVIVNPLGSLYNSVASAAVAAFSSAFGIKSSIMELIAGTAGCKSEKYTRLATVQGVTSLIEQWTGFIPDAMSANISYAANYECQFRIPSTTEINALYTRCFVTEEQWETVVKSNGDCVPWQQCVVDASKLIADPLQTIAAYRRELIDEDEYKERFDRLGIKNSDERRLLYNLTEQLPGMADILRMMTRDADDEQAVSDNELDNDFDEKYQEQLKQWSEYQGIPEKVAKYYWRSHWELPSNTAIYEMIRRLRPGRPLSGGPFDDINVTLEDAERILKTNDMAPKWVKPLLAISYATLTRVDIRRMHCIGVIKDDQLSDYYQDIGYTKKDADDQAEFTKKLNLESGACNKTGFTIAAVTGLYRDSGFTRDEAYDILIKIGNTEEQANKLLDGVDKKLKATDRVALKKAIQKRYSYGDIERDEVVSSLTSAGLSSEQAMRLASLWQNQLTYKRKEVTAATLCKWWGSGIITGTEYHRRLRNLGFTTEDTARIMNMCAGDLEEKKRKEAEAMAKKAKQEEEQRRKKYAAACARASKARKTAADLCNQHFIDSQSGFTGPTFRE